jgi:hypothetical protein
MTTMQIRAREKRKRIYDLRSENHSWDDIAKITGYERATCEKYFRVAVTKDGLPAFESPDYGGTRAMERAQPEAAAAVVAGLAAASALGDDEKFRALREAAKAAGMKPALVSALIKRLSVGNYSMVTQEATRLAGKQLLDALEEKTALVFQYLDEYAVSQASLKDLSIAANILIEKQQLLKNQPTQIIDFTSRQQLGVLLPAIAAEARRRGIEIEGSAVRITEEAR